MKSMSVWTAAAVVLASLMPAAWADDYSEPVQASLAVVPETAGPGQEVELRLTLVVNDPWHVFADTPGSAGQQKMKLTTKLPPGVEAVGEWQWPKYESVFEGYEVHVYNAGEYVFKQKLKVTATSGPVALDIELAYQACNPKFCGPPQLERLVAQLLTGDGSASKAAAVHRWQSPGSLLRRGADANRLIEDFGLTRGKAELAAHLHGQRKVG